MKLKINLQKPYLTKKIEASSFKTVLASTYQTAYRLYLITNGIKEVQSFYENHNRDYYVSATVKTEAAAAGDVKRQIWNVKHLNPLLNKKPRYSLRCWVTNNITNKVAYRCEITTINKHTIYSQIQECTKDLENILNK